MPVVMFLLAVLLLCSLVVVAKLSWDQDKQREADTARWESLYWPQGRPARPSRTLGETIHLCVQWAMVSLVPVTNVWLLWWMWPIVVRYLGY
jgi:hypothetical protein